MKIRTSKDVVKCLRNHMNKTNKTQQSILEETTSTRMNISRWENGSDANLAKAVEILDACDMDLIARKRVKRSGKV